MPPQLAWGRRKILDQLDAEFADLFQALEAARAWNKKREPFDVERHLLAAYQAAVSAQRRITEDLTPLLARREDHAPTIEQRVAALEAELDRLRARLGEDDQAPEIRRVK